MMSSSPVPLALQCAVSTAMPLLSMSHSQITQLPAPHLYHLFIPRRKQHRLTSNHHSSPSRKINTSRSASTINDTSTVDFIYMPSMADLDVSPVHTHPKVPVLPDLYSHHPRTSLSDPPMKPQIYTVAGEGADIAASAMSEVVDNVAVDIDPFSLTEAVGRSRVGEELSRGQNGGNASREPGVVRELWSGFLDDVLGPKEPARK